METLWQYHIKTKCVRVHEQPAWCGQPMLGSLCAAQGRHWLMSRGWCPNLSRYVRYMSTMDQKQRGGSSCGKMVKIRARDSVGIYLDADDTLHS